MKEYQEFPSMAEAVAHFYKQGYTTIDEGENDRLMVRGCDRVVITKVGFLEVVAEEV